MATSMLFESVRIVKLLLECRYSTFLMANAMSISSAVRFNEIFGILAEKSNWHIIAV